MSDEYSFYTGEVDGTKKTAICFLPSSGVFCEFQDPDIHDDWARFECPRTGKVVTYDGPFDDVLKACMGGHIRATLPAERWAEFRTTYLEASDEDSQWAREKMQEITPDPPAETGVEG